MTGKMKQCTKKIPCIDCSQTLCWFQGKKESNCPKWKCDREGDEFHDCEHCEFIDKYIEQMRQEAKK